MREDPPNSRAAAVLARLHQISSQLPSVSVSQSGQISGPDQGVCLGWLVAADNAVALACESRPNSSYAVEAKRLRHNAPGKAFMMYESVLAMREIIVQLIADLRAGLLTSIERDVVATTFDDLLDHAEQYLKEGRKDPAAVISSVVFEDTLHKLCDAHGIAHTGQTAEPLINALKAANCFTKIEGKEAVTAAGLRTAATHARWNEFNAAQVEAQIAFTRRLIREKLA